MAIEGVEQPEILEINETLRLRRYDGAADFAFAWYQDPELVYLVDGVRKPYDRETLYNMYNYLAARGELYFIEARAWDELGFPTLGVREIYDFNIASIRCFMDCGFAPVARTDKGWRYEAKL